jgi:hypothetical protein
LKPEEKHEQNVSLFNSWHIAQCNADHVGFGGKVTPRRVQNVLETDGQLLVKASLGLFPTAHLPDPRSATTGLKKAPPTRVSYKSQVAPGLKPVPSADAIRNYSQRKCKDLLKSHHLSTNGTVKELQTRLMKHHRVS